MADRIELDAVVVATHGNGMFLVNVSEGHDVLCTLSGKMKLNAIRVIEGDKVKIEVSPYDLNKGRIIFRIK